MHSSENPDAEIIRKRYKYRTLIVRGKMNIPRKGAVPLVGPDCAYHLYRSFESGDTPDTQMKDPRP